MALEGYESQLRELNSYSEKLTVEYNEKVQLQEVLEKAPRFFITDAPRLAVSELTSGATPSNKASLLEKEIMGARHDLDMHFSPVTRSISHYNSLLFTATLSRVAEDTGCSFAAVDTVSSFFTGPRLSLVLLGSVLLILDRKMTEQ
jgi:hypothetical protein